MMLFNLSSEENTHTHIIVRMMSDLMVMRARTSCSEFSCGLEYLVLHCVATEGFPQTTESAN